LSLSLDEGSMSRSEYALQRARSLFELRAVRNDHGDVARPHPDSATMLLRDLALRTQSLSGEERKVAEGLLARPDDPNGGAFGVEYTAPTETQCSSPPISLCFHWIESTDDAATSAQV